MPAVERQQRHHVEHSDEHVDCREQQQHAFQAFFATDLAAHLAGADHGARARERVGRLARQILGDVQRVEHGEHTGDRLHGRRPDVLHRAPCGLGRAELHVVARPAAHTEERALVAGVLSAGKHGERRRHNEGVVASSHHHLHGVAHALRAHGFHELARGAHFDAVERHDHIAFANTDCFRRTSLERRGDDLDAAGLAVATCGGVHAGEQHKGDHCVHQRPGGDHEQALGERLRHVGALLVGGVGLVHVVHADDAHERADGERAQPVFGLAAPPRDDSRAETHVELRDLHTGRAGGREVSDLVQEDRHDEAEHEDEGPHVVAAEPREQSDDDADADHRGGERDFFIRWCGRVATAAHQVVAYARVEIAHANTVPAPCASESTMPSAMRRACASAASTSSALRIAAPS